jgi:tetratricopeptide (TPR) repeat protein
VVIAGALVAFLLILGLGGCDQDSAGNSLDRHVRACSVAERNGLLESAVQACGTALAIAEERGYAPARISRLLYRIARLERQRGRFRQAEKLVRRSLVLITDSGDSEAVANRLIELSLSLAGQGDWSHGAQLLERASPMLGRSKGPDRKLAANAFRAFGVRLDRMGHAEQAERFKAQAEELAGAM